MKTQDRFCVEDEEGDWAGPWKTRETSNKFLDEGRDAGGYVHLQGWLLTVLKG